MKRSWLEPEPSNWRQIVERALDEDVGPGDITSACIDSQETASWVIEAQSHAIVCGIGIVEYLIGHQTDGGCTNVQAVDGAVAHPGDSVVSGVQRTKHILTVERTALNFLMHLSGVATRTAEFVKRVEGTGTRIVDTRKTTPGLRVLEKYAVRCGGGANHRMGLYDAAMLKDNHIKACGSISEAVARFRRSASHLASVEVECETEHQVEEALSCGVDRILLDNMAPDAMQQIVAQFKGRAIFEASGGVTLDTVREIAETGVDLISVGQITHSAPASSFHLEFC